ncbi:hypothetical protein [Nonomuraea salmonea]|uniref:hypothetical protein n=1 Tax=Nonomuraea salmonea TaxID=46181 RepID=UPI0031E8E461
MSGENSPPAVADHQRPGLGRHGPQHAVEVGVGGHGVRQQPVGERAALAPAEQDGDVDQGRLGRGEQHVERAHRAVAHRVAARPRGHAGRAPAALRVECHVVADAGGDVAGVDAAVHDRDRHAGAVVARRPQVLDVQQPPDLRPVADRAVAAAGGAGLDVGVGEDAGDLAYGGGQQRRAGGQLAVGDLAPDQHRGVLGRERELHALVGRERERAGDGDRLVRRVDEDSWQVTGDVGRHAADTGVHHRRDDVGGRAGAGSGHAWGSP